MTESEWERIALYGNLYIYGGNTDITYKIKACA